MLKNQTIAVKKQAAKELSYQVRDIDSIHFEELSNKGQIRISFCGANFFVPKSALYDTLEILHQDTFGCILYNSYFDILQGCSDGNVFFDVDKLRLDAIGTLQFLLPFAVQGLKYKDIVDEILEYCGDDCDLINAFYQMKDATILGGTRLGE